MVRSIRRALRLSEEDEFVAVSEIPMGWRVEFRAADGSSFVVPVVNGGIRAIERSA